LKRKVGVAGDQLIQNAKVLPPNSDVSVAVPPLLVVGTGQSFSQACEVAHRQPKFGTLGPSLGLGAEIGAQRAKEVRTIANELQVV